MGSIATFAIGAGEVALPRELEPLQDLILERTIRLVGNRADDPTVIALAGQRAVEWARGEVAFQDYMDERRDAEASQAS